jgi:hypothetical protein
VYGMLIQKGMLQGNDVAVSQLQVCISAVFLAIFAHLGQRTTPQRCSLLDLLTSVSQLWSGL